MVYDDNILWMHLYMAFALRHRDRIIDPALPIRQAFARSTDGSDCLIADCYTPAEFAALAAKVGFKCRPVGAAGSLLEMQQGQQIRY